MKTSQLDKGASVTLKYLLQILGAAIFFAILTYSVFRFWLPFLALNFSKVYYNASPGPVVTQAGADALSRFNREWAFLLALYSLFCYFANNFILDLYHKAKAKQLIISVLVDYLIVPLSILIVIIFDRITLKVPSIDATRLYNVYLVTGLLVAKVFIASRLISKMAPAKKRS